MTVLSSHQTKLIWARQHMDALRAEIAAFRETKPCVIAHDLDVKAGEHSWRVDGAPADPPPVIALRLGDALYNFRSVLDHMAWNLVLASDAMPSPFTAFPIYDAPAGFRSER